MAVDGRRARGEARRRELMDATLVVLARDGVGGLTHRAVAEEAGVPLASASYHFAGIDDLMESALLRANEELSEALAADAGPRTRERLAELLADDIRQRRDLLVAEYELYLLAMRRPHLRPAATGWLDLLADAFAPDLDARAREAFQAMLDGITLHALLREEPPEAAAIAEVLRVAWPGER